jgi:hypothetical protein
VTKKLQDDNITLLDVEQYFDFVMEFFSVTSDKLSHDNQILTPSSQSFIQACLKVMKDQEHDLTSFEIRELRNFQIYM